MKKNKQQKKRLKKYKGKYVTADRLDMSKGGRVKAAVGGKQKVSNNNNNSTVSIKTEEETRKTKPQVTPKQAKPVTEQKPVQPQAQQSTFTKTPTTSTEPSMSIGGIGSGQPIPDETPVQPLSEDTEIRQTTPVEPTPEPSSPEIMRGTTPPNTTFTTTSEDGQVVELLNMIDWEEQYKKDNKYPPKGGGAVGAKARQQWEENFKIAQQVHQSTLDNATATLPTTTTAVQQAQFEKDRRERIRETGLQIEAASTGQVPEGAIIPDAVQVGIDPETGKPIREQATTTMADTTEVGYQRDAEGNLILDEQGDPIQIKAGQVAPEAVTTGTATTAEMPQVQIGVDEEGNPIMGPAPAAQMEAAMVSPDAQVEAAEGEVSDQAIAQAAGVERVTPIEGAEVEIPEGALVERVVGKISEGAKATAAINAGTSLSRITRAKKQLSRAGLSDADIQEIGNDPEALEDRLADFSEEQRGIIEGLPEEALVSTQINGLLEGMENGEIPVWARPAVSQVEQMLAQRGLSASTVGRDNLFNSIIQSAMPIAQSNAQAIQSSVAQQRDIEARESEANAARVQQTALTNAQNVFQMDMAQFSSDQQIALSNSKFMQTVGLTEANNEQQTAIQDALLMSQANLAEADFYQKAQIQNAQAFLSMDMANLNNNQQANVLKAQQNQQRLLSNQSAQNAAAQFNAASENQTNQFMSNLNAQMNQYNASQMNAMEQFNATQSNAAEARRAGREADIEKFNAQLITQVDQFNSQQDFTRNQWNAQNAAAVEASNVQWRRQANTVNTAAQNQINMQNAQNAFGLSTQAMSFLWQELRDQADFDFRGYENEENRKAQIIATAMANEGEAGEKYDDYLTSLLSSLSSSFRSGIYSGGGSGGGSGNEKR
ncbi:hypothetical protein OAF13_00305 [Akkermansiaceae bacterium]|nr:hypothetical protein [Akkermansiaceae bacterium]